MLSPVEFKGADEVIVGKQEDACCHNYAVKNECMPFAKLLHLKPTKIFWKEHRYCIKDEIDDDQGHKGLVGYDFLFKGEALHQGYAKEYGDKHVTQKSYSCGDVIFAERLSLGIGVIVVGRSEISEASVYSRGGYYEASPER